MHSKITGVLILNSNSTSCSELFPSSWVNEQMLPKCISVHDKILIAAELNFLNWTFQNLVNKLPAFDSYRIFSSNILYLSFYSFLSLITIISKEFIMRNLTLYNPMVTACSIWFNIVKLCVLLTECVSPFHMVLTVLSIVSLNGTNRSTFVAET